MLRTDTTAASDSALEQDLLAACDDLQPELQRMLASLVRFPSVLGEEASAQDYMEGLFQGLGLSVDRFEMRDEDLATAPGFAPPVGHWHRHDNVVGAHVPRDATGRSLILNLPGQPKAISETLEGLKDADGKQKVPGIFAAVPYCIDLIGGPYVETNEAVVKAFRPKSAIRPQA